MSYRVTVRRGSKVKHQRTETLDEAIAALEHHASRAPRLGHEEFVNRRFEPHQLISVRVELKGSGVRAGVDVRGDGSMVAWTGRLRRAEIETLSGESASAALRRTLRA